VIRKFNAWSFIYVQITAINLETPDVSNFVCQHNDEYIITLINNNYLYFGGIILLI
jgi:hypothetical protein